MWQTVDVHVQGVQKRFNFHDKVVKVKESSYTLLYSSLLFALKCDWIVTKQAVFQFDEELQVELFQSNGGLEYIDWYNNFI